MLLPRFLPSFPVICAYFCWHIQSMVNIHAVIHFGLHVDMDRWKDLHQCLSCCHTRLSWLLLAYTTTHPTSLHAAASTWIFCLQYLTKTEVSVKLQLQASKHPSKDQQVTSYGLCPFFFPPPWSSGIWPPGWYGWTVPSDEGMGWWWWWWWDFRQLV